LARNIIVALDIGTSVVRTVVAEKKRKENELRVLGIGLALSSGVRRGVIVDLEDVISSIRTSVDEAQKSSGVKIKSVWLTVGGSHVSVSSSRGVVAVSRADQEISPEDVKRAIHAAESFISQNPNKEVLNIIPRDFKVDNEAGIKDPIGMHGIRLEVDVLIVECSNTFLKNLFKCVEGAGLKIEDYVFAPFASAEATLSKRQKELGVMLLDIGGGTTGFAVFEEGVPIHTGILPVGGDHITNDIAIGFRLHIDAAERMKLVYGSCLPHEFSKRDLIRLSEFVEGEEEIEYSRKELAEIIEARLQDLYELLQKELKKINRAQLLPAGVVLVGGSSVLPGLVELTKREIKLPTELGSLREFDGSVDEKLIPGLTAALGTLKWAFNAQGGSGNTGWGGRKILRLGDNILIKWLKSLLP